MKHEPRREELNSINDDGSRYIIHPADVRGAFTKARKIVAGFLILLYAALPWIPVNGYPAVYLDTELMRFHFMGLTFASQDMWLAFFLISGLGFGLFYVTALAGRVWCGWACPQTVFLEHVYRRVERWIEGDAQARKRLDNAPIGMERILKRGRKHVAFLVVSLLLAHVFMAYFLSVPNLWAMMHQAPGENWGVFLLSSFIRWLFISISVGFANSFALSFVPMVACSRLSLTRTLWLSDTTRSVENRAGSLKTKGLGIA